MSISNEDYNEIIEQYNTRQRENDRLLKQRKEEVYRRVPGYEKMDLECISLYADRARALIRGENERAQQISEQLEDLQRDLKLALTGAGYSINFLNPTYTCPDCRDTGFIDGVRCKCFKQAIMEKLFEQSNMRDVIESETFDNLRYDFQTGENARRFEKAVSRARNFVDEFPETYRNLCFTGTVGTGKSFLSHCIMGEVMKRGYACIYFSAPTLFNVIGDYKFHRGDIVVNPTELLYTCDLLVVDDLGTELTNSFSASELLTLLNERDLARRATVISTNLSLEELHARYSDRVFSRLFSNFDVCNLTGQDIRIYLKQMQNRK